MELSFASRMFNVMSILCIPSLTWNGLKRNSVGNQKVTED